MASTPLSLSQQEIDAGVDWVTQMYHDADTLKDVDVVSKHITDGVTLSLGTSTPLKGRKSLEELFKWKYGGCSEIEHRIQDVQVLSDRITVTLATKYTFKDGSQTAVDCFATWYKKPGDQRASKVEIYGDFHEVMDKLKEIQGLPSL
ncbi:hypothetical protein BDN72DRAFT_853998 [Pluteus cervinus]|uniref:Uncharacterized protein n=1 Tax=Pluteus cervinus TaxID=181527 RepID=A0ACD3BAM3_9AGAR|nr:hypothetical protein BDN72DRAFT_853998 [Pluteus cervinus]